MLILKNDVRRELTHLAGSGTCCVIRQSHLNTRNLLTSLNSKSDRAFMLQLKMAFRQQYSLNPGAEAGFGLVTGRGSQPGSVHFPPSIQPAWTGGPRPDSLGAFQLREIISLFFIFVAFIAVTNNYKLGLKNNTSSSISSLTYI